MNEEVFWPDILVPAAEPDSPWTILQRQADALSPLTGGEVVAEVERGSHGALITLDFVLRAPALNNYYYRLFKVRHGLDPEYPAEVIVSSDDIRETRSADELKKQLKNILGSPSTQRVVQELMALSPGRDGSAKSAVEV